MAGGMFVSLHTMKIVGKLKFKNTDDNGIITMYATQGIVLTIITLGAIRKFMIISNQKQCKDRNEIIYSQIPGRYFPWYRFKVGSDLD
jgi:hypothetical protein